MRLNVLAGLLLGGLANALVLSLHVSGWLRTEAGGRLLLMTIALHAAILLWALRRQRKRLGDRASFSRLLASGMAISFIAGVVLGIGSWVFVTSVDPTHLDWAKETAREQLAASDLDAEQQQMQLERVESLTPGGYAFQGFTGPLWTGLPLSLMLSAFLRLRMVGSQKRDENQGAGSSTKPPAAG